MNILKKFLSVSTAASLSLLTLSAVGVSADDSVVMTSGLTAEDYVKSLVGENIEIVGGSVSLSYADSSQIATFEGMSKFLDYDKGLMLSSGSAVNWQEYADNQFYSVFSDEDVLKDIGDRELYDGVVLEFTIIANGPELSFDYSVFSQEFGEGPDYGDYFGLFVNGENIARFDDGTAINVDTLYENGLYTASTVEAPIGDFVGVSNKMTCHKKVNIGDEVKLKLVVCDTGDDALATAVAIAHESISFNPELVIEDFKTEGNISFIKGEEEAVFEPFEIFPSGDYTKISTDGVNWYDSITISEPGENVELTIYMATDSGIISAPKTIYYSLLPSESSESESSSSTSAADESSLGSADENDSGSAAESKSDSSKTDTSKDKNPNTGMAALSASAIIFAAAAVIVKRRK